jgi:aminoglycoside phosphotransferase (APT) family kinase protein
MALKNRTDPKAAVAALEEAIRRHVDGAADVVVGGVKIPLASGMSSETVLFDATWGGDTRALVARVQPSGETVFPRYDLPQEFAIMQALAERSDVPVPTMLFSEDDGALLGAPFLVMERLKGEVPPDDPPFTTEGWVVELDPGEQATLYENAVEVLARIHAVDIDTVGLAPLRVHREAGFDGQLALWLHTFTWAAPGESNPTVERALAWIEAHRPPVDPAPVLCWGDARAGNMLFGDQLEVTGVLDWEMSCIGPRELDLGWWLFILRYYSEGIGAPPLPGFPDRDGFLTAYERAAGVTLDSERVDFYEVFAGTRLAILMHRAGNLMISAGMIPPDAPMKLSNPASHSLARMLGLPAPDGLAQGFAGNRS